MATTPTPPPQPSPRRSFKWWHLVLGVAFCGIVTLMLTMPFHPLLGGSSLFLLPVIGAFYGRPRHSIHGGILGGIVGGLLIGVVSCLSNDEMENIWYYALATGALGVPGGLTVGLLIHFLPGFLPGRIRHQRGESP